MIGGQIDGLQRWIKAGVMISVYPKIHGKYQYLTDISATISSLSSTKLSAIKRA